MERGSRSESGRAKETLLGRSHRREVAQARHDECERDDERYSARKHATLGSLMHKSAPCSLMCFRSGWYPPHPGRPTRSPKRPTAGTGLRTLPARLSRVEHPKDLVFPGNRPAGLDGSTGLAGVGANRAGAVPGPDDSATTRSMPAILRPRSDCLDGMFLQEVPHQPSSGVSGSKEPRLPAGWNTVS